MSQTTEDALASWMAKTYGPAVAKAPERPEAEATLSGLQTRPVYTPADVQGVMNRRLNSLFGCVGQELRRGGSLGHVTIDLAIMGNGHVQGASVRPGSAEFQSCISGRVRQITFPSFPAAVPVRTWSDGRRLNWWDWASTARRPAGAWSTGRGWTSVRPSSWMLWVTWASAGRAGRWKSAAFASSEGLASSSAANAAVEGTASRKAASNAACMGLRMDYPPRMESRA